MSRVILPEPNPRYDLSSTKPFGDVVYLCDRVINPFNTAKAVILLNGRLDAIQFDPEQDILCLTGQTIVIALTLGLVMSRWPSVRVLMFDARISAYKERIIEGAQDAH